MSPSSIYSWISFLMLSLQVVLSQPLIWFPCGRETVCQYLFVSSKKCTLIHLHFLHSICTCDCEFCDLLKVLIGNNHQILKIYLKQQLTNISRMWIISLSHNHILSLIERWLKFGFCSEFGWLSILILAVRKLFSPYLSSCYSHLDRPLYPGWPCFQIGKLLNALYIGAINYHPSVVANDWCTCL